MPAYAYEKDGFYQGPGWDDVASIDEFGAQPWSIRVNKAQVAPRSIKIRRRLLPVHDDSDTDSLNVDTPPLIHHSRSHSPTSTIHSAITVHALQHFSAKYTSGKHALAYPAQAHTLTLHPRLNHATKLVREYEFLHQQSRGRTIERSVLGSGIDSRLRARSAQHPSRRSPTYSRHVNKWLVGRGSATVGVSVTKSKTYKGMSDMWLTFPGGRKHTEKDTQV